MKNSQIITYAPGLQLSAYVAAYWTGSFNLQHTEQLEQTVVPNGAVELIIHLADAHCLLINTAGEMERSPGYTLIGLHTAPYSVTFPAHVPVFGIRFYPDGLKNIFSVPSAVVLDSYADAGAVFGQDFRAFCLKLKNTRSNSGRIQQTERFLLCNLEKNKKSFDYVQLAAHIIRRQQGMLSQQYLVNNVPLGIRQLQRDFKTQTGITAKEYIRIARLNAIHRYMEVQHQPNLTDISYEYGFADQAHFAREFKKLNGKAPRSFLKSRHNYIINAL